MCPLRILNVPPQQNSLLTYATSSVTTHAFVPTLPPLCCLGIPATSDMVLAVLAASFLKSLLFPASYMFLLSVAFLRLLPPRKKTKYLFGRSSAWYKTSCLHLFPPVGGLAAWSTNRYSMWNLFHTFYSKPHSKQIGPFDRTWNEYSMSNPRHSILKFPAHSSTMILSAYLSSSMSSHP